jgi:hypothetical protein
MRTLRSSVGTYVREVAELRAELKKAEIMLDLLLERVSKL